MILGLWIRMVLNAVLFVSVVLAFHLRTWDQMVVTGVLTGMVCSIYWRPF